MRFGSTHRLAVGALAALGAGALVSAGALDDVVGLGALVALGLALARPGEEGKHDAPLRALIGAGLVAAVWLDPTPLSWLSASMLALQIERLATRDGAMHDLHILALALLHLATGALLGGALQGACLLLALPLASVALWLSLLRRHVETNSRKGSTDRHGNPVDVARILRSERIVEGGSLRMLLLWSGAAALVALAIYAVLPRPSAPHLGASVPWPSLGRLRTPSVVLVARAQGARPSRYFRQDILDAFDGRAWSRSFSPAPRGAEPVGAAAGEVHVRLLTKAAGMLPVPERTASLDPAGAAEPLSDGLWRTDGMLEGYRATLHEPPPAGPLDARERYLARPHRSRAAAALAAAWTRGATTPLSRAQAIESGLKRGSTYDLRPSSRGQSLDDFLEKSRRGHCELFASAMAMMLREEGIPSRVVVGYLARDLGDGRLLARGTDAHAWVEAFLEGQGWTRFDPTPPASSWSIGPLLDPWLDPVDWRWNEPSAPATGGASLWARVVWLWPWLLAAALAWLLAVLSGRRRVAAPGPPHLPDADHEGLHLLYEHLEKALRKQGLSRAPGVPPLQHAQSLAVRAHPLGGLILRLTERYVRARFGGEALGDEERRSFEQQARQIADHLLPPASPPLSGISGEGPGVRTPPRGRG